MARDYIIKKNRYQATIYFDPAVYSPEYDLLEIELGGLIVGGYCIGGELSLYSRGKVVLYFNPTYQHHDKRRYALDKITEVIIHAKNQS